MLQINIPKVKKSMPDVLDALGRGETVSFCVKDKPACEAVPSNHLNMSLPQTVITMEQFMEWPAGYAAVASANCHVAVVGSGCDFVLVEAKGGSPFKPLADAINAKSHSAEVFNIDGFVKQIGLVAQLWLAIKQKRPTPIKRRRPRKAAVPKAA